MRHCIKNETRLRGWHFRSSGLQLLWNCISFVNLLILPDKNDCILATSTRRTLSSLVSSRSLIHQHGRYRTTLAHFEVFLTTTRICQDLKLIILPRDHRFIDPVFGIAVGLTSSALKIQKEQREKYPQQDNSFPALWQKTLKLNRAYWGTEEGKTAGT